MKLPFSLEQFLSVFRNYNNAVWPMQVILYVLAAFAIIMAIRQKSKLVAATLSFLWIWMGVAYHLAFFVSINKAAYVFGSVFILQGLLLAFFGVVRNSLQFEVGVNAHTITGTILILYALVVYPIVGNSLGRVYPTSPTFGLPCPTTIFTFGVLLWTRGKVPVALIAVPVLWSIVGMSAAMQLGVREDIGLIVASIIFLIFRIFKKSAGPANVRV